MRFYFQIKIFPGLKHTLQFFLVRLHIFLGSAKHFLHIAGAGSSSVSIIAVSAKSQPHGLDIIKNFLRRDILRHFHPETGVIPQAAGAVYIKIAFRRCHKPQITIGRMGNIFQRIGKTYLQLSRHFFRKNERKQIFSRSFCPGHYIKIFICFHTGQRGTHNIPRIITSASQRDNPGVQGLLHQLHNGLFLQIV